jgi:hypothetical protein
MGFFISKLFWIALSNIAELHKLEYLLMFLNKQQCCCRGISVWLCVRICNNRNEFSQLKDRGKTSLVISLLSFHIVSCEHSFAAKREKKNYFILLSKIQLMIAQKQNNNNFLQFIFLLLNNLYNICYLVVKLTALITIY